MRFIEIRCEFYPNIFGNESKEIMKLFFSLELLQWEIILTDFLVSAILAFLESTLLGRDVLSL